MISPSGSTCQPAADATPPDITPPNICRLTDAQKKVALERLGVIQPLIDLPARTEQDVIRIARPTKFSARTVYRWLSKYLSLMLPSGRHRDKGFAVLAADLVRTFDELERGDLAERQDGAAAEIAVVGNEGLIGVALFMGGETTRTSRDWGRTTVMCLDSCQATLEFQATGPIASSQPARAETSTAHRPHRQYPVTHTLRTK